MDELELDDIQALLRHGYPYFDAAGYCPFVIDNAAETKLWLRQILHPRGTDPLIDPASMLAERIAGDDCSVSLAFTCRGLHRLGVAQEDLQTFASEFQEGMAEPRRSRLLGDTRRNAPGGWLWGGDGDLDGLLIVFSEPGTNADYVRAFENLRGCPRFVRRLTGRLGVEQGTGVSREPFGFADGISQPHIEGLTRKDAPADVRGIQPGEFVLGYRNEIGRFPASPSVAAAADPHMRLPRLAPSGRGDLGRSRGDLGRNGTFLVMRELRQHVDKFRRFVGGDQDPAARRLAARMVGRWRDGAPLALHVEEQPGSTQRQLEAANGFGYHHLDRHGLRCPIGSHIRRANPRDSLADELGLTPEHALELADQHRILRRGRAYDDRGRPGLVFICLNANIERQFEFVQSSWIMHPEFGGLRGEYDPLLGPGGAMTIQHPLLGQCVDGLQRFVTVRGGGYFFLPGIRALNYLAELP